MFDEVASAARRTFLDPAAIKIGSDHMFGILSKRRQPSDNEPGTCPLAGLSRRAAMTAALTASLSFRPSGCLANAGQPPAELIQRTEAQAVAFMRGEMERWSRMVNISDDFTLMQPFGGPASHGFDSS